jgi:hypothetical protein
MKKLVVPILCVLAAIGFASSVYLVFLKAPLQFGYTQDGRLNGSSLFWNQKIFYWHVAHAFWLFGAVFMAGFASIITGTTSRARPSTSRSRSARSSW